MCYTLRENLTRAWSSLHLMQEETHLIGVIFLMYFINVNLVNFQLLYEGVTILTNQMISTESALHRGTRKGLFALNSSVCISDKAACHENTNQTSYFWLGHTHNTKEEVSILMVEVRY